MLKRLLCYGFLLGLIIASAVFYSTKTVGNATPPVMVEAIQCQLQPWQNSIHAVGSLSANQGVVIKAETSGRLTAIYFRSGDDVKAGDPLVQLNPDILQAQLDAAKAQTELSYADYQRGLSLYKKKVFAKADLDKISANYHADIAKQAQAQAALAQTLIRAPFSGRLGLRLVNQGDTIDPSKPIVDLEAINPLRVDFAIPGTQASQINIGSKVLIHTSAYPNKTFIATLYAKDAEIDVDTRSLSLRASLSNPQQLLLPGAFVDVTVELGQPLSLIIVPETAVDVDQDGSFVYRIIHHKAIKTPVTIQFHQDGKIGVNTGLHPGDTIISVGGFKVHNDSTVIVGK